MTPPSIAGARTRRLRVMAFAKVNLTLRVFGPRPDGYHDLRTVFQSVALCDRLSFDVASGPFQVSSNDPTCPTDESNLVWQAAVQVWRAAGRHGRPAGVQVDIRKGIPSQAGLGGASSDAAAALRALTALWCHRLEPARVMAMAARLGADVPFFLTGGTSLGVERGDRLFPVADWPLSWVVIAQPRVGVNTTAAYRWLDEDRGAATVASPRPVDRVPSGRSPYGEGGNDFQPVVERRHPVVRRLTSALRRHGADWAAMSGSGSAVFGLFSTRARAEAAAASLRGSRCAIWVTRTLSAREYRRRSALVEETGGRSPGARSKVRAVVRDLPGREPISYTHRLR